MSIRKYIFEKLIFSKTIMIDKPGIVIGTLISKFGNKKSKTRIIFYFEDLLVNLYDNTKNSIGKEKANLLWYKIGKEVATRYFAFYPREKVPKYLRQAVINHVFNFLSATGLTFVENVKENSNENLFSVSGKNPSISEKTKSSSLCAGILSGILSFVYNKNIEACCNRFSKNGNSFVASKNFHEIYVPNKKLLKFREDYSILNFKNLPISLVLKRHYSLKDMIKFKKTYFHKHNGLWVFEELNLFPAEIGLFGVVLDNYFKENLSNLFFDSYLKSSESIFKKITINIKNKRDKLTYFSNVFSSLGFGIPIILEKENEVVVKIINPPISKYGSFDRIAIFNGALNVIFNKKLLLKKYNFSEIVYSSD